MYFNDFLQLVGVLLHGDRGVGSGVEPGGLLGTLAGVQPAKKKGKGENLHENCVTCKSYISQLQHFQKKVSPLCGICVP